MGCLSPAAALWRPDAQLAKQPGLEKATSGAFSFSLPSTSSYPARVFKQLFSFNRLPSLAGWLACCSAAEPMESTPKPVMVLPAPPDSAASERRGLRLYALNVLIGAVLGVFSKLAGESARGCCWLAARGPTYL